MGKGPFPMLHNISQRQADFRSIFRCLPGRRQSYFGGGGGGVGALVGRTFRLLPELMFVASRKYLRSMTVV